MSVEQVLEVLEASDDMLTVQQIAERCGLHPSNVRRHLDRLHSEKVVRKSGKVFCSDTGGHAYKWGRR